ncbi:hypothetical protein AAG570_002360 [Ranatra chinensis]|uniref:Uncharacterized protein n=1 Tax=Ranatra chinensis TaxID=642074 RepID=A0ABD0Y9C9_9HEMI
MENLMKENPHKFDDMKKKDPVLNENLKTIYVTSSDPQPKVFKKIGKPSESRMLPVDRRTKLSDDLAFMEPEVIPAGKISLKQALKILSQHQSNSEAYNMYYVSDNYKIGKEVAENILHYYKTFKVYIPPKEPKLSVQAKFNQFLDSQTRFDDSVDNSQQKLP